MKVSSLGSRLKTILLWLPACLPAILCLAGVIILLCEFRYPAIDPTGIGPCVILTLIALLPTILWAACWFAWFRRGRSGCLMAVMAVVCVLWMPVTLATQSLCLFGPPIQSETRNPAHYLKVDRFVAENDQIAAFFPAKPGAEDVRYFYHYNAFIDYNYEIIAEWTLPPEEIAAERQRIETLLADKTTESGQRGRFKLLMVPGCSNLPFAAELRYYDHVIFAWDEERGLVRYILAVGMDVPPEQQPEYPALDW